MNRFLLPSKYAGAVLSFALATTPFRAGSAAPADDLPDRPFNLVGPEPAAQIECTTPDGRAERLRPNETNAISGAVVRDEMLSCPLQEGVTTFVIKLPSTTLLDRFTFVNENAAAAGELKIAVSNYQLPADSPRWQEVDGSVVFSCKRLFNLSMLGVEARYVKLSFHVESSGRLANFGLYGGRSFDRQAFYRAPQAHVGLMTKVSSPAKTETNKKLPELDYASQKAKGRVIYVSSGQMPTSGRMIDDSKETAHRFAISDARPTATVELAPNERVHRVTATYRTEVPGRFDVYLVEDVSKSATDLNYRTPVASATDEDGDGEVAVDFDPQGSRYVTVRFTPEEGMAQGSFEIVEINVYGDIPLAMLDLFEAPDVHIDAHAVTFPGEGAPDISSKLGVIAIPPVLPAVSP